MTSIADEMQNLMHTAPFDLEGAKFSLSVDAWHELLSSYPQAVEFRGRGVLSRTHFMGVPCQYSHEQTKRVLLFRPTLGRCDDLLPGGLSHWPVTTTATEVRQRQEAAYARQREQLRDWENRFFYGDPESPDLTEVESGIGFWRRLDVAAAVVLYTAAIGAALWWLTNQLGG